MDIRECWSTNREEFPYSTLRGMIEGELENLREGTQVWRGTAEVIAPHELICAKGIIAQAVASAAETWGENAAGYISTAPHAQEELQTLINAWIERHAGRRKLYRVIGATAYVIKRSDFTAAELEIVDEMQELEGPID